MGAPQFGESLRQVAKIPQRDAGGLMRDGGLGGSDERPAGEDSPRLSQRQGRPGKREIQKITGLDSIQSIIPALWHSTIMVQIALIRQIRVTRGER